MAKQKPPDPKGKTTGFPYHLLWEHLGPDGKKLGADLSAVEQYELLSQRSSTGASITPSLIDEKLHAFGLVAETRTRLATDLYYLAAAYRLPALQAEAGFSPKAFARELRKLAREAEVFLATYRGLHPVTNIVLWNRDQSRSLEQVGQADHLGQVTSLLEEIAAAAILFADDMPRFAQGRSAEIFDERFLSEAITLVRGAGLGPVKVLKFDGKARNYRAGSKAAELLLDYVALVAPKIVVRTISRIVDDHLAAIPET